MSNARFNSRSPLDTVQELRFGSRETLQESEVGAVETINLAMRPETSGTAVALDAGRSVCLRPMASCRMMPSKAVLQVVTVTLLMSISLGRLMSGARRPHGSRG